MIRAAPGGLDRPVWTALTTRQADLARGQYPAFRLKLEIGLFGAAADTTPASLNALADLAPTDMAPMGGGIWLVETGPWPPLPGLVQVSAAACHQMIAFDVPPPPADFQAVELADADAPAMLALATLTVPGPFFSETHRFGGFIGVKQDGVLVAMAGERMRVPGATEVSGVCTHPAHRGRGHANALIRAVAGRILARGEVPFLHVYATNTPAIALYQSLGFTLNRVVTMTAYRRAG